MDYKWLKAKWILWDLYMKHLCFTHLYPLQMVKSPVKWAMRKDTLFSKVKKLMLIQPLANLLRLVPRSPTLDTFQTNVQRQVLQLFCMGVWQGVAMDSLTFYPGPPCSTSLRPGGDHPWNGLTVVSGVAAHRAGGLWQSPTPFWHPTPYVSAGILVQSMGNQNEENPQIENIFLSKEFKEAMG